MFGRNCSRIFSHSKRIRQLKPHKAFGTNSNLFALLSALVATPAPAPTPVPIAAPFDEDLVTGAHSRMCDRSVANQ